ncbi:MAG: Phosphoserine phosphatase related protein [Candidatus Nomurabacteria bacterium GW2011_GWB1_37_5]|uniref:Phosphoserine phosphatase related protein n=1 Tax=Candidatus Nomurabacteria bacterium GW2011_GWB1_37_5 TaxID=1618742 RepID=A0A0G0GWH8_9BACT|nr:MAG: Phosphoserine phosphatase related protein [Candidatus Nomurabacteria bacterium GW2011_GWB1_37_5]
MENKRKFAVLDCDGTIGRKSLMIEQFNTLIDLGIINKEVRKEFMPQFEAWQERKGSFREYVDAIVKSFESNLIGVSYDNFCMTALITAERCRHHVYNFSRTLIEELKRNGYFVIIISHSPKEVLNYFGEYYGIDKIYGMIYVKDDNGLMNGEIEYYNEIIDKSILLEQAIQEFNLTTEGSIGMGDTASDVNFLQHVENPICINPNSELHKIAREKNWIRVVERKDMVYFTKLSGLNPSSSGSQIITKALSNVDARII